MREQSGHKQLLEDVEQVASKISKAPANVLPEPSPIQEPMEPNSSKEVPQASADEPCQQPSSSEQPPGSSVVEDPNQDITNQFTKEATEKKKSEKGPAPKERFFACDLVIPAIALKKFKILESSDGVLPNNVGVLGQDECQMCKTKKARLCTLMFGDYFTDNDDFWAHAVLQCKNHRVGGVFLFDSFVGDPTKERWGAWLGY